MFYVAKQFSLDFSFFLAEVDEKYRYQNIGRNDLVNDCFAISSPQQQLSPQHVAENTTNVQCWPQDPYFPFSSLVPHFSEVWKCGTV